MQLACQACHMFNSTCNVHISNADTIMVSKLTVLCYDVLKRIEQTPVSKQEGEKLLYTSIQEPTLYLVRVNTHTPLYETYP